MTKKKKQDTRYRVSFTVRNDAARHVEELMGGGLYGRTRSKTAEMLFVEGLKLRLKETRGHYHVVVEMRGYNAYVVDNLARLFAISREKLLEQIVQEWAGQKHEFLAGGGITLKNAVRDGYLPRPKDVPKNIKRRK